MGTTLCCTNKNENEQYGQGPIYPKPINVALFPKNLREKTFTNINSRPTPTPPSKN